jgi:hypothetical protein
LQCKTRDVWEGILVKLTSPTKDERDQILKKKNLKRSGLGPLHRSTGPVEILTHVQNWTRVKISMGLVLSSFSTCVKISTGPVLLCIGHNPFPLKGNGLSPVHKSTGPVEILTHLQKLDTCQDLNGSSAPVHWTQSFPFEGERLGSSAQKHLTS